MLRMLYIALAAALAYLCALRLRLALLARIGSSGFVRFGLALLSGRAALRRTHRRGKKRKDKKMKLPSMVLVRASLSAARYLLPRIRVEQLRVVGRVSTQDAAQTALLTGGARAAVGLTAALLHPGRTTAMLLPDFSGRPARVNCFSMVSVCVGHIICAGAICAWNYLKERHRQWISTRLKTS